MTMSPLVTSCSSGVRPAARLPLVTRAAFGFVLFLVSGLLVGGCGGGTCAPRGDSGGCGYPRMPRPTAVRDFDSCVASGGTVVSAVPPQVCRTADGMTFSQFFTRQS